MLFCYGALEIYNYYLLLKDEIKSIRAKKDCHSTQKQKLLNYPIAIHCFGTSAMKNLHVFISRGGAVELISPTTAMKKTTTM